jgi:malate synthase
VERYVMSALKAPWYVDLLNLNIDNHDLVRARARIDAYMASFARDGTRITDNPDFVPSEESP